MGTASSKDRTDDSSSDILGGNVHSVDRSTTVINECGDPDAWRASIFGQSASSFTGTFFILLLFGLGLYSTYRCLRFWCPGRCRGLKLLAKSRKATEPNAEAAATALACPSAHYGNVWQGAQQAPGFLADNLQANITQQLMSAWQQNGYPELRISVPQGPRAWQAPSQAQYGRPTVIPAGFQGSYPDGLRFSDSFDAPNTNHQAASRAPARVHQPSTQAQGPPSARAAPQSSETEFFPSFTYDGVPDRAAALA